VDNKDFSTAYMPQRKDAAGISLGYPDKELFRNWNDRYRALQLPKLEVFYTLSMRKPSLIPELRSYRSRVSKVLDEADLDWSTRRDFWSNKDLLASMAYTDDALQTYFKNYCHNKPGFNNTLFVITGNREKESELENEMVTSTPVPLILYSPLLKRPETFNNLVSHTDITPGLLHILDAGFKINMPTHVAWTGSNLSPKVQHAGKEIPIYGANGTVKSLIKGKYLLGENKLYQQGKDRIWYKEENTGMQKNLIRLRSEIRLRNEYLIAENKILPEENTIFKYKMPDFSKREIAWINSVFNGKDYDAAYDKARELALSNNSKHSLLLCQYILANVPGHVDTEILMARIYGWQEHFGKAEAILERTIQKYPSYPSGYEALLDVCYWSNNNTRALEVARLAEANNVREKSVLERITRARNIANSDRLEQTVSVLPEKVRR